MKFIISNNPQTFNRKIYSLGLFFVSAVSVEEAVGIFISTAEKLMGGNYLSKEDLLGACTECDLPIKIGHTAYNLEYLAERYVGTFAYYDDYSKGYRFSIV